MSPLERDVPPAGEEIHLPGASIQPVLLAAFVTIALVGVTTFWEMCVIGGVGALWTLARWIADTRRDVAELPLEHHFDH
jgi:hypothetical protein